MAWENRKNRSYFYRKMWVKGSKGRVVSEYHGTGEMGKIAQFTLGVRRHRRNMERAELYQMKEQDKVVDQLINDFTRQVMQFVAGVLVANGYRQHHRGEWRKQRMSEKKQIQPAMSQKTEIQPATPAPNAPPLMTTIAVSTMLDGMGLKGTSRAGVLADHARVRSSLGWETAPPLEQLLIDTVALCWLRWSVVDGIVSLNATQEKYSKSNIEHLEARSAVCHRRYLASVLTLARVRRLNVNLQINIANQQVITGLGT